MKVLICDKLDTDAIEAIKATGHDVTVQTGLTPDALKEVIPTFECAVIRSATKLKADILEHSRALKLIVRAGVGLDNVDLPAAKAKGITVHNTPNATSVTVAEHTFALMLSMARHICTANALTKSGVWEKKAFEGTELFGKTVGIIGFGRIGQEVAKRAKAFHMSVMIYNPGIDPQIAQALEVQQVNEIDELLAASDYVTLHLPHSPETHHMIDATALSKMKKTAYLVNCARGGIVDEAALTHAVTAGTIAGAAMDVFEKEPVDPTSPLLACDKILCMPHLGASTKEGQKRAGMEVVSIINDFCNA